MKSEKIKSALKQLSDTLSEEYGDVPHGSRRDITVSVDHIDVSLFGGESKRFIYLVDLTIQTTSEENYGQ